MNAPTTPGIEATIASGLEVAKNQRHQGESHGCLPIPGRERKRWMVILAATVALTAFVVAGTVGGGLGASLANSQRNLRNSLSSCQNDLSGCRATPPALTTESQSSEPTRTAASMPFETTDGGLLVNYVVEPSTKVYNISADCNALASSIQTTTKKEDFRVYCDLDLKTGSWINGDGNAVILADIIGIFAYSMADCLQACSQYTAHSKGSKSKSSCGSVTLGVNMSRHKDANCWLKNSTITHSTSPGSNKGFISATKIS